MELTRALRIAYNSSKSDFEFLLENNLSITFYQRSVGPLKFIRQLTILSPTDSPAFKPVGLHPCFKQIWDFHF